MAWIETSISGSLIKITTDLAIFWNRVHCANWDSATNIQYWSIYLTSVNQIYSQYEYTFSPCYESTYLLTSVNFMLYKFYKDKYVRNLALV